MKIRIFGLNADKIFTESICDYLDMSPSPHTEKYFPDREPYLKSDVNVRGDDVYVVASLYTDESESVNDKFAKLLIFIGSLKDASAARINLVAPYLPFQRADRKTESRAPITTKYFATMLEAVGTNRVLSMDVHNLSVFQNSFRIPTDNLEARNLMVDYVASEFSNQEADISVLSPDSGGVGRAERFRKRLAVKTNRKIDLSYMGKIREGTIVHGDEITGDIEGKVVLVVDDMIASGSTLVTAASTIEKHGGKLWAACATHPLFIGNVNDNLIKINRVIVTDTITPSKISDQVKTKVKVLSTTKLFARAIRRIHDQGGSISDLLK